MVQACGRYDISEKSGPWRRCLSASVESERRQRLDAANDHIAGMPPRLFKRPQSVKIVQKFNDSIMNNPCFLATRNVLSK